MKVEKICLIVYLFPGENIFISHSIDNIIESDRFDTPVEQMTRPYK